MNGTAIDWVDDLFHLFGRDPPPNFTLYLALSVILLPVPILFFFMYSARPRQGLVPPYRERVLILGASSGVGEQLALQYAHRGCRNLVLVARRKDELERVRLACEKKRKEGEEWDQSQQAPGWEDVKDKETVTIIEADCTKAEDLIAIRQTIRKAMGGLDTMHIVFGASALKSLLGVAGVDPKQAASSPYATLEGIQTALQATSTIHHINVASTAAALATFIPLLQLTSPAPSIVLLSSVAALVPPPTRSLYAASKAAQLHLFQAVRIESQAQAQSSAGKRKDVKFLAIAPATIRTAFRLSAVDGTVDSSTSAKDSSWDAKGSSDILEPGQVAYAAIKGSDRMEEGIQTMPGKYRFVRYAQLAV